MSLDISIIRRADKTEVHHGNITHNVGRMAEHIISKTGNSLYQILWRPDSDVITDEYYNELYDCMKDMSSNKDYLIQNYTPSNGWGNYDGLLELVVDLMNAIIDIRRSGDLSEYYIFTSV